MSARVRFTVATVCAASLVVAIAIIQIHKADADNRQPATATPKTAAQPNLTTPARESIYLEFAAPQPSAQASAQKVRQALEKSITVHFKETPLKDAVNFIATQCGIKATLNIKALNEEGIADDEPVTLTRNQPAPATAVLKTVLEPIGLTTLMVTIESDTLVITTEIDAEEKLDLRLYDISRLAKLRFSPRSLIEVVQDETSGPWMNIDGTGGTIDPFEHLLAIESTEKVHAETKLLLNVLERIATGKETTGVASLHMIPQDRKVYAALSRRISGEFQKTPLTDVAAFLADQTRIDVLIDEVTLAEEGIPVKEPITTQLNQINLKSALKLILEPHDLTYIIEDGTLRITTAIDAEENLSTFAFNIRDFHEAGYDAKQLIKSLRDSTSGPWMEIDGTGGTVYNLLPGFLIIRQTWGVLDECIIHLENLRAVLKQSSPDGKLPKTKNDPRTARLTLKQYTITSFPIEDVHNALPKFVAADSWKSAGGRGELAIIESKIIVRQTREVHDEIEDFLQEIGEANKASWSGIGVIGPSSKFGIGNPGNGLFQVKQSFFLDDQSTRLHVFNSRGESPTRQTGSEIGKLSWSNR